MHLQRVRYKDIEQIHSLHVPRQFKQEFQGSAPAPFIGRFGYPQVNIGILSPQFVGEMEKYDSPKLWSSRNLPVNTIASLRTSLVHSRATWNIKDLPLQKIHVQRPQEKTFIDLVQEVGMAKKAAEVEVSLKKIPVLSSHPEREIIPFGPGSEISKARITCNTNIDSKVESVVRDTGLKASSALLALSQKGFEENILTKLISVGVLGLQHHRKLVPTRWSITAVDDTLGKKLIQKIKQFSTGEYRLFWGGGWGNYYLFLFFPDIWGYELFETYLSLPQNPWSKKGYRYSTDFEGSGGRKTYAEETAGGYYAARLPVLEKMNQLKRQHSCLALRFITSDYTIPLGVWVCREAARKSLAGSTEKKGMPSDGKFSNEKELFTAAGEILQRELQFDIHLLLNESKLLQEKKGQMKLASFG